MRASSQPGHEHLNDPISAHLRRDALVLTSDHTVGEALGFVRSESSADRITYFYAVDSGGRLAGIVPARRPLNASPGDRLGSNGASTGAFSARPCRGSWESRRCWGSAAGRSSV